METLILLLVVATLGFILGRLSIWAPRFLTPIDKVFEKELLINLHVYLVNKAGILTDKELDLLIEAYNVLSDKIGGV